MWRMFTAEGGLLPEVSWLETATGIFVHLLLAGSALVFFGVLVYVTFFEDPRERTGRVLAFFAGALIVVGAEAAGVTYSALIIDTLAVQKPFTFGFLAVAIPGIAGTLLSWYLISLVRRSSAKASRMFVLVGMLALTQFALAYVEAVTLDGAGLQSTAVPNIVFVLGIALYLVFYWESWETDEETFYDKVFTQVRSWISSARGDTASSTKDEPSRTKLEDF